MSLLTHFKFIIAAGREVQETAAKMKCRTFKSQQDLHLHWSETPVNTENHWEKHRKSQIG